MVDDDFIIYVSRLKDEPVLPTRHPLDRGLFGMQHYVADANDCCEVEDQLGRGDQRLKRTQV